jgi:PAS domain S-box-containing protein
MWRFSFRDTLRITEGNQGVYKEEDTVPHHEARAFWVSALRAAAGVARNAVASEADVFRALTQELHRLKLRGSATLLTDDGMLEVQSQSMSNAVTQTLQRLTGLGIRGYRFDPNEIDAYRQVLESGEAVFTTDRTELVRQLTPKRFRAFIPRIMRIIGEVPAIIAPLILSEKPIGTINVSASWLTEEDRPMLSALADHIAIALGQVRARNEIQDALKRESLRNEVAQAITSQLDLPTVLETTIRVAIEVTSADAGAIGLVEDDGRSVSFPHVIGLPDEIRLSQAPVGTGLIWKVLEARNPLLFSDYPHSPEANPIWVKAGIQKLLGVPLIVGEKPIGGLGLFIFNKERSFGKEQADLIQSIGSMAAVAIDNARLYTNVTQRAQESQALIRTARSISSSLDQDTVLRMIAKEAKSLLQADASRIHLLDNQTDDLNCVVALGPAAEAAADLVLQFGQGLVGYVAQNGEPIILNNTSDDPRGVLIPGTSNDDLECLLITPLSIRQRIMGTMTVQRDGLNRPFKSSDLELLNAFATQAAVTLENAHLFGQIAAQAQQLEAEVAERTRDLSISEARYRALVETSLAGIFQVNPAGTITYVNQAMAELCGYDADDLIGKSVLDIFPPNLQQPIMEQFDEKKRHQSTTREVFDIEIPSQQNRHIPVLLAASLIADVEGNPQGVSGLVLDISRQKNLEAALQAERDRLDVLLTNIGDAVMVTDINGTIEYVNPGWERLTGYSQEEALGKRPNILKSGRHDEEFYRKLWDTILAGKTWRGDVVNCHKDGTFYDAALTITPVSDDAGEMINFVSVSHDISALKELDRLKSQFVSDVSHELRTPLTNIRLYLDLLNTRMDDPDKFGEYLQTLQRESERLANLIDDLLSLSRLDADAVPFVPVALDINEILTSLVTDRQNLAAKRGLNLTIETTKNLSQVTGDARLLTQVFTNLLTNAMNYTPNGGTITLRARKKRESGENWVIAEVDDTGLGISPEEQKMIFRRFFRGSASKITGAPGTGLGLSICMEILERHEGRITVQSEGVSGEGSCFSVWLPANENH